VRGHIYEAAGGQQETRKEDVRILPGYCGSGDRGRVTSRLGTEKDPAILFLVGLVEG
jgi:hypothetical protein